MNVLTTHSAKFKFKWKGIERNSKFFTDQHKIDDKTALLMMGMMVYLCVGKIKSANHFLSTSETQNAKWSNEWLWGTQASYLKHFQKHLIRILTYTADVQCRQITLLGWRCRGTPYLERRSQCLDSVLQMTDWLTC